MPLTQYHVTGHGPVNVLSGRVELNAGQALRRENKLRAVDGAPVGASLRALDPGSNAGVYEVAVPTQFKPGETFGWDGVPPKQRAHAVEQIGENGDPEPVHPPASETRGQEPAEDEAELQKQVESLGVEYKVGPIKETLDELEVEYPGDAKKATLARILVENVEPEGE
jgi:hypothetical protein